MPHCKQRGYTETADGQKVTFHRIPADEGMKKMWLVKIKRDEDSSFKVIQRIISILPIVASKYKMPYDCKLFHMGVGPA